MFAAALAFTARAEAETGQPQTRDEIPDSRQRTVLAERRQGEIIIDGIPDEADWQRAEPAVGFIQEEPRQGEPAMEETRVRVLYDDDNLYIAAWLYDSDPSRIARQLTRRDNTGRAAGYFEFSLDPNDDGLTGYQFRVTAAGVQRDRYLFNDTSSDDSWNAVWESAVSDFENGWMAEVRLPLNQLRYESSGEQRWGVNFARRRIADNERSSWAWTPSEVFGTVSRFGQLHGMDLPERGRYLEVLPYAMSGMQIAPAEPGDPFFDGRENSHQFGADIRYGLGSTFMADLTLNPDFGQTQVDPQVVNLSAFEVFFPERRNFFTRDDRIFNFSLDGNQNTLFHSRRIGRRPQGRAPSGADFTEIPGETSILGAGKITGRTQNGLNVGVLGAITDSEHGRAYFEESDEQIRFEAEPRTHYGIARLQQDLRGGASQVGAIATVVDRELPANGSLDFLTDQAVTVGMDFAHSWSDRLWWLEGYAAGSHVSGSKDAILGIQRSSAHFRQRPDQDYMTLDPDATSLSGGEWRLQLRRRSGRFWSGNIRIGQRTPGFEVNDMGFLTDNERIYMDAGIEYNEPVPGDLFQNYSFSFDTNHSWRNSVRDDFFSGAAWSEAHKQARYRIRTRFTFLNWWNLNIGLNFNEDVLSDTLTRGGPLMVDPGSKGFWIGGSTDRRDLVTWQGSVNYSEGNRGGSNFGASLGVEARPTNGMVLSANLSYDRSSSVDQYVTQVEDEAFDATFGARYLFADLEREELSLNLRANLIFTPNLSLEFFAQPLLSAGDFITYKQLARPSSFDFIRFDQGEPLVNGETIACQGGSFCRHNGRIHVDYNGNGATNTAFRDRDFTLRSLRGNAVLRWEYSPGSRLFVVWQHDRQSREALGDLKPSRDAQALLDAPSENVFMIKINRWMTL